MDEANLVDTIFTALRGGNYAVVAASAITLTVWIGRRFVPAIYDLPFMRNLPLIGRIPPRRRLAVMSAFLSTLAALAATIADPTIHPADATAWAKVVVTGITQGATASGLWSLVLAGKETLAAKPNSEPPSKSA